VNVVDSSAWLSWFADDANADRFASIIEDTEHLLVPTISLTEVYKVVLRQRGESAALVVVAHMRQGRVVPLNENLAVAAAQYGMALNLPLADSIIYATARSHGAQLWTQDADFRGLENVHYFPKA